MAKFFILIAFKVYLTWCTFYMSIERFVNRKEYPKIKKMVTIYFESLHELDLTPMQKWDKLVKHFNFKWRADKWYMMGDVIGDAYLTLWNHGGDCDDFANIALTFFTEEIKYNNKVYKGLFWSFKQKGKRNGHAIAVWKAEDGTCLFVSNGEMFQAKNENEIIKWFKSYYGWDLGVLVKYTKDFKVKEIIL